MQKFKANEYISLKLVNNETGTLNNGTDSTFGVISFKKIDLRFDILPNKNEILKNLEINYNLFFFQFLCITSLPRGVPLLKRRQVVFLTYKDENMRNINPFEDIIF